MKRPAILLHVVVALSPALVFGQGQRTPAEAYQPSLADIPSVDPEVERASFQLPEGLEARLFAGEPLIKKPIQIAWDQGGRLWVASSETYPQIKPGEALDDKIVVLEDIPTGLFPVGPGEAAVLGLGKDDKGPGCYVANSTQILFLRDTDDDGRADQRHVMLSGFGTEDTHHIIHTFRGAPDGGFYFNQSIYIHTHTETPWGVRRLGGGGVWHFRPETGQLEIFCRGQVNPWGHVIDQWGQSFTSDGAYSEGVNYAFPGAAFFWAKEDDWTKDYPRILKGLNPGQPKHAGIEIITGRHFPDDWQGTMALPDFRGNRINRFVVTDNGSGYASKQVEDVIKTTHRSFRPVDLKMGPDGALYIADWYNPIIQHGEVDFRDLRRDHTHGRIWRLAWKNRPLVAKPKIAGASVDELFAMLKAPEDWTRFFAKRELRERGGNSSDDDRRQVSAAASDAAQKLDLSVPSNLPTSLELFWVCEGNGGLGWMPVFSRLSECSDPKVRAAALRCLQMRYLRREMIPDVIGQDSEALHQANLEANIERLGEFIADAHPRVRLEAIHCLHTLHTAKATEVALDALDKEMDENLDFALWQTCRDTRDVWLPAFQKGEITFGGNFKHVVFALKATGDAAALGPLVAALGQGKIGAADRPRVLELISQMGGPAELGLLLERRVGFQPTSENQTGRLQGDPTKPATAKTGRQDGDPTKPGTTKTGRLEADTTVVALDLLTQAIKTRRITPASPERALAFLDDPDPATRRAAARLCGTLKLEAAREKFVVQLSAPTTDGADLEAALEGLVALGGDSTRRAILSVVDKSDAPLGQRARAVATLAALDVKVAAARAAALFEQPGSAGVAAGLFDAFLTRKEGPAALAAALSGKKLAETIAQVGLQKAGSAPGDTKALLEALAVAGNLKPINQTLSADEMQALVADVKSKGNAARGQSVYRRAELLCQNCHAIGGGGPDIGPDLVSIGASAQVDYLIESMVNPSAKIKEGYHTSVITTKDGNIFAGAIVQKDGQQLTLRDAAGATQVIPALNIAKNDIQPVSLMPPGLTASLRKDEFLDLIAFLSQVGREGEFKVPPQNYVRRWRVLTPSPDLGRVHNLAGDRLFVSADPALSWLPAYSSVEGALPAPAVPPLRLFNAFLRHVAQFEVEVTTPGPITFSIPEPDGLKLVAGEMITKAQSRTTLTLPQGVHPIAVFGEAAPPPAGLKIELVDDPAATGRARLITGR
jgi:putative heme-binding domain-containing protein